jgi:hypothetical protein
MLDLTTPIDTALDMLGAVDDPVERRRLVAVAIRSLSGDARNALSIRTAIDIVMTFQAAEDRKAMLRELMEIMPVDEEFVSLYIEAARAVISAILESPDARQRKTALVQMLPEIPARPEFAAIYRLAADSAIEAANDIEDPFTRRFSLATIAEEFPRTPECDPLRLRAYAFALGLSDEPICRKDSLADIAHELPKTCDYEFYRMNTFLGISQRMPKTAVYRPLYLKAIETAIEASTVIDEPYYKKYALIHIANEVANNEPGERAFSLLYRRALEMALDAAVNIKDPFVRNFALIDMLRELPKSPDFYDLILKAIENTLPFFSVRRRLDDVEVIDVIDYVIVAEERRINESRKNRYTRENHATRFAKILDEWAPKLSDVRFIDVLKPYSHVWIQPPKLRESVKKAVDRLEGLKDRFHGKEVLRPVFVAECFGLKDAEGLRQKAQVKTARREGITIAIDLGATNTLVMMKKPNAKPHYVRLDSISTSFASDVSIVPTLLSRDTDAIGKEAEGLSPVVNIKKLLLEEKESGRAHMERFFFILYRRIRDEVAPKGWLKVFSGLSVDNIYVTVPVGFQAYRRQIAEIASRVVRGVRVELIDEPLAAAIGYQVADEREKFVMVIDFGGCTMDVMALRLSVDSVHVVAKPDRSEMLGGRDVDLWLAEFLAQKAGLKWQGDPPVELVKEAERLKIALSDRSDVEFRWEGREVSLVTRDDLERVLDGRGFYSMVDRAVLYVFKKMRKVGLEPSAIEAVILTGGSSQIPSFKDKIGDFFPSLRAQNAIYDHSPLTAVATGAALYGSSEVTDRHLAYAYALRHMTSDEDHPHGHELLFEKGASLPFEASYRLRPARTLGAAQNAMLIELFEAPESLVVRRWVSEGGTEFIKQVLRHDATIEMKPLKKISLEFEKPIEDEVVLTFSLDAGGHLTIRHGEDGSIVDAGVRLQ